MADLDKESAAELVKRGVAQLRELVSVELELAKREASRQARQFVASVLVFAVAIALLGGAFAMGLVALFLAVGPSAVSAVAIGAGLLGVATVAAFVAYRVLPKKPMARTAARVEHEIQEVKEAIAS